MTSKEIKALTREELNLKIDETVKSIQKENNALNKKGNYKELRKDLSKLIKEFNKRGYGIWILK